MTEKQILQAFNNRWRIKGFDDYEVRQLSGREVCKLCLDFFRTGILLASTPGETTPKETAPSECHVHVDTVAVLPSPDDFDLFWSLYDKKIAKPKCQRLWQRLSPADRKLCLDYIPRYKQAQPDKQYRKNPETFLRNKSWNDELIYRYNNPQQHLDKLASILTD